MSLKKGRVSLALWRFGAEIDVVGAIRVLLHALGLTADGWKLLTGLKLATRLGVIHGNRPKVVHWYIGRQMELVGFGAIECLFAGVQKGNRIVGPGTGSGNCHRGSHAPVHLICEVKVSRVKPPTLGVGSNFPVTTLLKSALCVVCCVSPRA